MQLSITLASCRPTTSASCSLGESSEDYGDDDAVDGRMTSTSSPKTGVKYHLEVITSEKIIMGQPVKFKCKRWVTDRYIRNRKGVMTVVSVCRFTSV